MSKALLTVAIKFEQDVVVARQRARQIAGLLGFDGQDQTRIATAVSEIARNAFEYARGGKIEYFVDEKEQPQRFMIRISDKGGGIADVPSILQGTETTGIIGAKRLMDHFSIESKENVGTIVVLGKNIQNEEITKNKSEMPKNTLSQNKGC